MNAVEISSEQTYQMLFHAFRDAVNQALWPAWLGGNTEELHRVIATWQANISYLPQEEQQKILQRLEHDIGVA